ncbi:YraN family protein [Patescibacteria group bacterium]|nr:YraN family protein [Patescibacteria group bacterium]MBU1890071.1 YraN family protein [Patescibacteria group bacterium]
MGKTRQKIGRWGEKTAAKYLEKHGYIIVATNENLKGGELDLVCKKNDKIIFVEVRTKTGYLFGTGEESITPKKALKLATLSHEYLEEKEYLYDDFQVDLVVVEAIKRSGEVRIRHLKNVVDEIDEDLLDDV